MRREAHSSVHGLVGWLAAAAMSAVSTLTHASGLGWYAVEVPWGDFSGTVQRETNAARDALAVAPQDRRLQKYLQQRIDEVVWDLCVSPARPAMYRDVTPRWQEFYDLPMLAYARDLQHRRGIAASFFDDFVKAPARWHVIDDWSWTGGSRGDPMFVLSPDEVSAALREVRAMNRAVHHPVVHAALLEHLEAVLLMASVDLDPSLDPDQRTGLLFCGHD